MRMVKGESPERRAENWPPRDVIRKQREKKPMPRTKSLRRATGRVSGAHPDAVGALVHTPMRSGLMQTNE